MFATRKDVEEELGKVVSRIERLEKKVDSLFHEGRKDSDMILKHVDALGKKVSSLEQAEGSLSAAHKEEMESLKRLNSEFQKSITSFRILQDKAQKKLFEEASAEIRESIGSLAFTARKYANLEKGLIALNGKIDAASSEVDKLVRISSSIRKEDYVLSNFLKGVALQDKEKLRLMEENEKLKRLVSKERRKTYNG